MITLHHCPEARSTRSLWLLNEIGLPFELVEHAFGPDLRNPDYLAVHPLGRVPALVDGDLRLMESGAICEYLCETYAPGLWRAPGTAGRAEWLQWLHFAETLGQHLAALTQQHIVIFEDRDRSPLVMKLEARRLEKGLGVVDAALAGRDWMLADGFSGVDTQMGYSLWVAARFVDLAPFPGIRGYLDRIADRPAFRAALPGPGSPRIYARPFYAAWPG